MTDEQRTKIADGVEIAGMILWFLFTPLAYLSTLLNQVILLYIGVWCNPLGIVLWIVGAMLQPLRKTRKHK